MLEIVMLGTGAGIPTRDRNHPAMWLHYGEENMLWDCGEGTQRQMMLAGVNLMKIDNIFITHWHADHWAGLISLFQTMNFEGRKRPLYIHAPEAERFVKDILDLGYWGLGFEIISMPVQFEENKETVVYESNDFLVTSIPVKHSVPAVAYAFREKDRWNVDIKKAERLYGLKEGRLVGKLKREGSITLKNKVITLEDVGVLRQGINVIYSGDTMSCKNLATLSKNADLLITDATFIENMEDRMHMTIKDAIELAENANAKMAVLTHFSRRHPHNSEIKEEAAKYARNIDVMVAKDLMRIEFRKGSLVMRDAD
ncbi:MAG: ribonuclease Z [Candidatus Micrarchaeota archaeon]|nr:ribonuclease Z [Candidatus Micrarchaeota archaeon]